MRHWIVRLLFALLCTLSWPSCALDLTGGGIVKTEQVRAELLVHAPEGAAAGKPLWLGLQLQHAPHWHSYWKNAGDSGLPTELRWTLPAGVAAGEIAWPTPRKFPLGELANYGYDGQVLLAVPLRVSPGFQGDALVVKLQANWLVCRQECIPEEGHFQVRIPSQGSTAQHARLFQQAWDAAPRPQAAAASRLQPDEKSLQVSLDGLPAGWRGQSLEIFPETAGLIAPGAPWTQAWNGAQWTASLPLSPERSEGPSQVALVVALAGKAGSSAGVRMEVPVQGKWPAAAVRSEMPEALKQALAQSPQDTSASASASSSSVTTGNIGLWAALLGALAGGLILNLMPCVFPVLAIKVMAFARHADDRRAHRRAGLAYTAGVLLSFLALGGLLLALRAAGEQLGWGFQLQNPAVVAGLALLFTMIGLNLAGLFDFGRLLPASLAGVQLRHPLADAFLTGVLAVAVASPCTAPFMGASLGLAIGLPTAQALSVFAAIGIGMALPYLAASFFPWVAHALPRPGAWMETLRQFMAFPMLATVVWLLWVLGQQTGIDGAATLLLALLLLAWLAWAINRRGKTRRWLAPLLLAGLLGWLSQAGGRIWTPVTEPAQATTTSALPTADRNWHGWTPERMAQLQASGKPVLVDYTAAWCVTCQYNKGTVLADRDLLAHLADAGVVLLRADWTRRDPAVTQALAAIGRNGVPTYALYLPGKEARLLSELPSRAEAIAALGRR